LPLKKAFCVKSKSHGRKEIIVNRIGRKLENDAQQQKGPMRIMANSEQIGSKSIVIYLFSKPNAKKLFICNRPASIAKLIEQTKWEATFVSEQYA